MATKFKNQKSKIKNPQEIGYSMPAEWEPHTATWIAWPHNKEDWPGKFAPIPWIYAEIVRLISAGERVRILVEDADDLGKIKKILARGGVNLLQIDLYVHPT